MQTIHVRDAVEADLPMLLEIYNDAVVATTAVWDDEPRTLDGQAQWFDAKRAQGHPVLVAVESERIAGFCSYGWFRPWHGYRYTVENSVYVHGSYRRCGVGRQMLSALIQRAAAQGMHAIIGGIEARNLASIRLHESLGYREAARLHEVGRKFDRWLDLVLMERRL